jgi:alpha-glucosidase (family GH31 glycosyl hydrolase)
MFHFSLFSAYKTLFNYFSIYGYCLASNLVIIFMFVLLFKLIAIFVFPNNPTNNQGMIILRQAIAIAMILLGLGQLPAQTTDNYFKSFEKQGNTYIFSVEDGAYQIQFIGQSAAYTVFKPTESVLNNLSYATEPWKANSKIKVIQNSNKTILSTSELSVEVSHSPFSIQYFYNSSLLFSDNGGFTKTDTSNNHALQIETEEVLYGGGARVLGMNRRGNMLQLYNRAHYGYTTHSALMNYTLPMYISSKKYAVLFDNPSSGWLDLDKDKTNTIRYHAYHGATDYYVIAGDSWLNLTFNITQLTGRQPLPPRWAFGNFSSRFGYHSQQETEFTVNKYFEDSIPLDAVIIDIYWFGKGIFDEMGNLDWYTDSFPKPDKMISDFKTKGINTILVTEPFVLTTSKRWKEAVDAGIICTDKDGAPFTYDFYFGNTGLIDVFKPAGSQWFWDIYKQFTLQGIGGWWGDLGEPEVHPAGLQHINGSADQVHNAYGHQWAKLVYEGYKTDFPNQRPFILMRAGYAGSQRYGMIPWTGDVSRSWGGLVPQTEISLQMGMQGLAYMHSDLGGFAGGDSLDNELYTRWLQYGVFQPIYRPHAQEQIPSEPVFQTPETKARAKAAIELRYKLLPYNYTMAYYNSSTGKPLMTPLFYSDNSPALLHYDSTYMWGSAFLISPVKSAKATEQAVYLPKNAYWFNFYSEKTHQGGKYIHQELSLENIPTFVKAGSFVPMQQKPRSASEYNLDALDIHFYYHESIQSASDTLFHDNGNTPNTIENDNWEKLVFDYSKDGKTNKIVQKHIVGKNYLVPSNGKANLIIHGAEKPKTVKINTVAIENYSYKPEKKLLSIPFEWNKESMTFTW